MKRKATDAVVVGGGLIGCSVARALAGGGLDVVVVERAQVGREASYAAAGMLAPQAEIEESGPMLDLCLESRALFPDLAEALYTETGVDVRYRDDGTIVVAFGDDEASRLRDHADRQHEMGLECEMMTAAEARRAEPALSPAVSAALSIAGDHQVDNRRLVEAMALSCYARKVEIVENTPVRAIVRDESGRVAGVETTAGTIHAPLVVVAAGCWSSLVEQFPVPVEPVKGQMLMLELASPLFRRVLRDERCYLVSRIDGRVLVGATMERAGFDKSVFSDAVGKLLEAGRQIVPSLASAFGGEAWAGLRPATPDGIPAVGFVEEGLVAATGHFRNGILLAPVTAEIVSRLVFGGEPHPATALLDPRRFLGEQAA